MPSLESQVESEDRKSLALHTALLVVFDNPKSPIFDLIEGLGYDETIEIMARLGGQVIYIPKLEKLIKYLNVSGAAIAVTEDEMGDKEAAKHFGVSLGQLRKVVSLIKSAERLKKRRRKKINEQDDKLCIRELFSNQ